MFILKCVINDVAYWDWMGKTWVLHHVLIEFNLFKECYNSIVLGKVKKRMLLSSLEHSSSYFDKSKPFLLPFK